MKKYILGAVLLVVLVILGIYLHTLFVRNNTVSVSSKTANTVATEDASTVVPDTSLGAFIQGTNTSCTITSFTANPTIVTTGASSVLSWVSKGCTGGLTLSTDGSNDYPLVGSANTGPITVTKLFTISDTGSNGTASKSVTVTVKATTCVINSFTAKLPEGYSNYSNYHDLSWTTTGCSGVTINGVVFPVSGSMITPRGGTPKVWPVYNKGIETYTLSATGGTNGTQTKTVTMYYPYLGFKPSTTTPPAQNIARGTTNVKLADFDVTLSGNVIPQTMNSLQLQGTCLPYNAASPYTALRFMIGATQVASVTTLPGCVNGGWYPGSIPLTQAVTFNANETKKISIYADVSASATIGASFTPTLSGALMMAYSTSGPGTANATTIASTQACTINSFTVPSTISTTDIQNTVGALASWSTTGCTQVWWESNYGGGKSTGSGVPLTATNYRVGQGLAYHYPSYDTSFDIILYASNANAVTAVAKVIPVTGIVGSNPNQCVLSSFSVTPNPVAKGGTVTLAWSSKNCTIISIRRDKIEGLLASDYLNYSATQTQATISNESVPEVFSAIGYTTDGDTGPNGSENAKMVVLSVK